MEMHPVSSAHASIDSGTPESARRANARFAGLLAMPLVALLIGCGDSTGPDITVAIDPTSVTLLTGESTRFTANITGGNGPRVTWSASCGTIEGQGLEATYTAPAEPGTCTVTVASRDDPSKTANATVTVNAVGISISPTSLTLTTGESGTFTATVTGTANTGVTWSATCGTIQGTGATITYTAPAQPGSCTVTVTSNVDPTKSVSATVTVTPTITVSPSAATLFVGQTRLFSVSVAGEDVPRVEWSASCGTITVLNDEVIIYAAPAGPGECEITATSVDHPGSSATAVVTVQGIESVFNLLGNGTFDTDVSQWTPVLDGDVPRAVWADDDVLGDPASGSAEVRHPGVGNGATRIGLMACLPVEPGQRIIVGGSARMVEAVDGAAPRIWVRAYAGPGCNTDVIDVVARLFDGHEPTTEWTAHAVEGEVPEGATRIDVILGVEKEEGVTAEAAARFDNVFVSVIVD